MATAATFGIAGTKNCEGGIEVRLIVNGVAGEGRVFRNAQAFDDFMASRPITVDDLLWLAGKIKQSRGLTIAQMVGSTLTVDWDITNVVRIT